MAAISSVVKGPKGLKVKSRYIDKNDSTATVFATIPKGGRLVCFVLSGTASDAVTSSVLDVGNTSTANEYVSTYNLKTGGAGVNVLNGVTGALGSVLTTDTPIYAKVTEVGNSNTGGWYLHIVYTDGNFQNDDSQ